MEMPTYYSTFLMRAYENNNKILPSCRSPKAEDIRGTISAAIFLFIVTDITFVVKKLTICTYGALQYGALHTKGLLYTQYGQNICYFPPPWMGRLQYFDQNNQ